MAPLDERQPHQRHSDDDNDNDTASRNNATEAGLARGAVRSVGRSVVRRTVPLPTVGRLPRTNMMPGAKQVARLSDRASTGYDVYQTGKKRRWQPQALVTSLVKNTLLGLAVFETYTNVLPKLLLPQRVTPTTTSSHNNQRSIAHTMALHSLAGGLGGAAHAVVEALWKQAIAAAAIATKATPTTTTTTSPFRTVLAHHSIAHAVLFGSYPGLCHVFQQALSLAIVQHSDTTADDNDRTADMDDIESSTTSSPHFLATVALGGGVAGMLQHGVSEWTERRWVRSTTATANTATSTKSVWSSWRRAVLGRPLMWAALPSSLAFVALEYGTHDDE